MIYVPSIVFPNLLNNIDGTFIRMPAIKLCAVNSRLSGCNRIKQCSDN